jgi:hypothetical protein
MSHGQEMITTLLGSPLQVKVLWPPEMFAIALWGAVPKTVPLGFLLKKVS